MAEKGRFVSARYRWPVLVITALAVTAISGGLAPYAIYVARAPGPHGGGMMPLAGIAAFLALCGINAWRSRKGRKQLATPGEELAFLFIVIAGCAAAGWGFTETLIPLLTAPHVMAPAQAGWTETVLPNLPSWAMGPQEEPWASGFYQGLEKGKPLPLLLWLRPSLLWGCLAVAITLVSAGVSGFLSKRWLEHDRLTFPYAEVLGGIVRGFLSNKMFWYAVALAAAIPFWNITQRFLPMFQRFSSYLTGDVNGIEWMTGMPKIALPWDFGLVGILFFVQRDIILSIVVFFILIGLESRLLTLGGIVFQNNDMYYFSSSPSDWQMIGALVVFVAAGLWKGRKFLAGYLKSAREGGEGGSWLSPRAAVACLIGGLAFLVVWLAALGLRGVGLPTLILSQLVSFIGAARIFAESGLGSNLNVDPGSLTAAITGTSLIGAKGFMAIVLSYWGAIAAGCMMVLMVQAEKLNADNKFPRGTMPAALGAVLLAVVVTMVCTVALGYRRGAITFASDWTYTWHPRMLYDVAVTQVNAHRGPDLPRLGWIGAGGLLMGALIFLRANVVGWFLQPVGLLLGHQSLGVPGSPGATTWVFIGLVALGLKTILLRMGGVESYERAKPFFAGLVVGSALPGFYNLLVNLVIGPPLT